MYLPVDGRLSSVQLWAITCKAAMPVVYKSFYELMLSFLLGKYLGLEWQDGRVVGLCF